MKSRFDYEMLTRSSKGARNLNILIHDSSNDSVVNDLAVNVGCDIKMVTRGRK